MSEFDEIISITEEVIGSPRRLATETEWVEYNCPNCSSIDGVKEDGKYNLCVNYRCGTYHCWKCQEKGRLSKLVRQWGGQNALLRYREEIKNIRNSKLFSLGENCGLLEDVDVEETELLLPDGFVKLTKDCGYPYEYVIKRGLNDYLISRFNIGYIPRTATNWFERNRIVVPSYDGFGSLNYWVARDYITNSRRMKYCNPQVKKTKLIFNELLVNWYEDITLVEGVFDHIVTPNSIPLLGKKLDAEHAVCVKLRESAMANINIFLDADAEKDAFKIYRLLNQGNLRGRIRMIAAPIGEDPSSVYQKYGMRGIVHLMNKAYEVDEFTLEFERKPTSLGAG